MKHKRFSQDEPDDAIKYPLAASMPSYMEEGSTSGDDDAPETVSLRTGKEKADEREAHIKELEQRKRQHRKAANQAREAAIREARATKAEKAPQASSSSPPSKKGKKRGEEERNHSVMEEPLSNPDSDESVGSDTEATSRMERAMKEAAEEDSDDNEQNDPLSQADTEGGSDEDDFHGIQLDAESMGESKNDYKLKGIIAARPAPRSKPVHLPDSVFAAAAASLLSTGPSARLKISENQSEGSESDGQVSKSRRKRPRGIGSKDKIVGSRAFRKISDAIDLGVTGQLCPPARRQKFVKRTLSGKKKGGWVRRAAHLSGRSMQGPALGFARSSH